MLNKLFTSKTRVKILSVLIFNQDKEYHLREIAKKINAVPIFASKELENLADMGLIIKRKKANLSLYSINPNCSYLNDLKNIFIKTDLLGEGIKEKLDGKTRYCLIYGSFAKGTENSNSDIDLMVISEMKEDELLKIINKIEIETKREINHILWNEKTFKEKAKNNHLLKTINKNKVIMLIGDENEFRKQIK